MENLNRQQLLVKALADLEAQMRKLNLWGGTQPSAEALASQQPFACDLMSFPEWLQFIFTPRLLKLMEQQQELPSNSDIAPMAEHYFQQQGVNGNELIGVIRRLDQLLSAA